MDNNMVVYKIVENKSDKDKRYESQDIEVEIQVGFLNMLHELGLLADNVYSIAINRTIEGVIK